MEAPSYFVVAESEHDAIVAAAYRQRGFDDDEVEAMVRLCRETARHGIRTHNAIKALHLDELFGTPHGGCVPGARIEKLPSRFGASRVWVANRKLGPAVAYPAMEECLALAETFGVGMVSVDEAWHYLWGGAYVLEAARRGFVGYTNCTAMLAEVVPFGGVRATLGTNPHSWAFPTTDVVGFPVLVDFATSSMAMGRVQQLAREGRSLPPGSAVDGEGRETTDPGRATALLPFGAHKGFGLGLVDEILAGIIGGFLPTLRGLFAAGGEAKRTPAFFFMAIHPEALSARRHSAGRSWKENLGQVLADILAGNERTILPGKPEADMARRSERAGGLLFTAAEMDAFDAIACRSGCPSWPRVSERNVEPT